MYNSEQDLINQVWEEEISPKKKIKQNKRKVTDLTTVTNLKYSISYDTIDYYPCRNGSSCCDNDYCRCHTITGYDFSNAFGLYNISNFILSYSTSSSVEDLYLEMLWLKNQKGNKVNDWFEGHSCSGYYGEETASVTPTDSFIQTFFDFIELPIKKKFEEALKAEYGYVLPELNNPVSFSLRKVKFVDIVADEKVQSKTNRQVISNYSYYYDLYFRSKSLKRDEYLTCFPMCVKDGAGKYRVVDGHHRYNALSQRLIGKRSIWIFFVDK